MGGYNSSFSSPQVEQALSAALLQEKSSYNITQDKKQNYASLTEAIAAVSDEKYKVNGLVLTFYTGTEWVSKRYNGADASGFATEDNWVDAGAGKKEIAISESEPLPESTEDVYYQIEDIPDEEATEYVTEAPADDNEYVRKNKGWVKSSGGGSSAEITKESVEAVLTGNIESHTHDTVYAPAETDVWDGVTVSESLLGTGTEEDPYQINSCADWIHFIDNPKQYSGNMEQLTFSFVSVNKNLDFNNNEIDRTDKMIPLLKGEFSTVLARDFGAFIKINFNNNTVKNVNILNGNIYPLCMVSIVMNMSINGTYTFDMNTIDDNMTESYKPDFSSKNNICLFGSPVNDKNTWLNVFLTVNSIIDINVKIKLSKKTVNINMESPVLFTSIMVHNSDDDFHILNNKSVKINVKFDFSNVIDDSGLNIIYTTANTDSKKQVDYKTIILDTTKGENYINGSIDKKRPGISPMGCIEVYQSDLELVFLDHAYMLSSGNSETDESLAPYTKSKIKSESELKDPSFLNILNSASGENIWITGEDGFPTLNMQQKDAIKYDGYVKQSEFDKLKEEVQNNVEQGGGTTTDYSPYMLSKELFTLIDSSSDSITSEQISTAIGGLEGLQAIINAVKDNRRIIIKGAIIDGVKEDSFVELNSCLLTEADVIIGISATMVVYAVLAWIQYAFAIKYTKDTKTFELYSLKNNINPS